MVTAAIAERKAFAKVRIVFPLLGRETASGEADGAPHKITQLRNLRQVLRSVQESLVEGVFPQRAPISRKRAGFLGQEAADERPSLGEEHLLTFSG